MRYETDQIPCLYAYFNLPWTHILYHDRFANQLTPLNNATMLGTTPNCEMHFLGEAMSEIVSNKYQRVWTSFLYMYRIHYPLPWNRQLSERQRAAFVERYFTSMYSESIKTNLLDFLSEYEEELPMYFKPDKEVARLSTG